MSLWRCCFFLGCGAAKQTELVQVIIIIIPSFKSKQKLLVSCGLMHAGRRHAKPRASAARLKAIMSLVHEKKMPFLSDGCPFGFQKCLTGSGYGSCVLFPNSQASFLFPISLFNNLLNCLSFAFLQCSLCKWGELLCPDGVSCAPNFDYNKWSVVSCPSSITPHLTIIMFGL